MRNKYIRQFLLLIPVCGALTLNAQVEGSAVAGTNQAIVNEIADNGITQEKAWRTTGASFTISGAELERTTAGNLLNTLQGRIPGLTVISGSGEPGYDSPTFVGRGVSSWNLTGNDILIYLDGFQVSMGIISSLSANEIESVTYLKDAAALASFGLKGGSGVLSIKTKRGVEGKTKITVNARYGLSSVIDLPTVANAYDYTRLYNEARTNDGLPISYADPELYKGAGDAAHPNVNWYDEVLKDHSNIQGLNLSFLGGNNIAKYFVLLDYTGFGGDYKDADVLGSDYGTNAKYSKFNVRGNVDIKVTKNFSIKSQVIGSMEDKDTPAGFTASDLFRNLMVIPASAFSVRNPNGSWGNNASYSFNPVERLQSNGIWNSHTRGLQANLSFNEKLDAITPGLSFNGGISFSNQYVGYTQTSFTGLSYEMLKDDNDQPILDADGNYTYNEIGSISDGISNGLSSLWNRQTTQFGFAYDRTFGKHSVTGSLLASRQNYTYFGLVYPIRDQGISFNGTYDYDQKYIVSLTAAYNGSADFEKGHRYGLFPALGLGWVASNEDFLKDNEIVNFLKIRVSLGLTGDVNQDYRFLNEQLSGSNSGWNFTNSNTWYTGRRENSIPNLDFTWEKKTSANIGIDAKLFDNKLSITADYFNEKRTDIIESATSDIPAYTGFRLLNRNTGEVKNSGFEAMIGYDGKAGDFEYYAKVSGSYARNEIVSKSQTPQPYEWLSEQGYRINQVRGYVADGFYQEADFDEYGLLKDGVVVSSLANVRAGDIKFKDQNADGIIDEYDKVPQGYSNIPELTGGLNLGFKWKGFDFDVFVQAVTNRTLWYDAAYVFPFIYNGNNVTSFSSNYWTPENAATATSPRLTTLTNLNNTAASDYYMVDGSFIKLRSVELGYTFNFKENQDLRVFVSGNNLFTWDKIDDLEAENLSGGYPLSKTFSVGLKMNF